MNILYVEHYAGSDRYGMEFRPFYLAREWAKAGHAVTIVAADYSHLRRENPAVKDDFAEETDSGVRYVWVKTRPYRRNDLFRVANMLGFVRKVAKHAEALCARYAPDVIVHSSTYPMDVTAAQAIAACCGAPVFYEIHDLWPLSLLAMAPRISAKNPVIRYVQKAEDTCYREDDGVITLLPGAERHVRERGFAHIPVHYIPNGVVLPPPPAEPLPGALADFFARQKAEGRFVVVYAGGHARSNALDCLVEAAALLPPECSLVLVGRGDQKERLRQKGKGLSNLFFFDALPKAQVPSLLQAADALYLGAKDSPLYRYGVGMNKMFDYMLAVKPVLCGVRSPDSPLELSGCALMLPPEDAGALAAGIRTLAAMGEQQRAAMGRAGAEYVRRHHDYRLLAAQMAEVLQQAVEAKKGENKA